MKKSNNLFRKYNNMGVIVNKNNYKNDELARRIDADLRAKALETAGDAGDERDDPDFAEDAEYIRDLKKTSRFGWVWIVLIVLAILSVVSIVFL